MLQRIQQDLTALFTAPPQSRHFFEEDDGFGPSVAPVFAQESAPVAGGGAGGGGDGDGPGVPGESDAKQMAPGAQRREIRRKRLRAEAQLRSGQNLLTEQDVTQAEEEMDAFLKSRAGAKMLDEQVRDGT